MKAERYDDLCRLLSMATGVQRLRLALMGVSQVRRMALGVLNGATVMLDGQVIWGRHHMPKSAGGTGSISPGRIDSRSGGNVEIREGKAAGTEADFAKRWEDARKPGPLDIPEPARRGVGIPLGNMTLRAGSAAGSYSGDVPMYDNGGPPRCP